MPVDAVKMHSERNWDEEKFSGLMQEAKRTHFTHFGAVELKPREGTRRIVNGAWRVWKKGKWRKESTHVHKSETQTQDKGLIESRVSA